MKKDVLKKVYFHDEDDRNLDEFVSRFLESGLLWIYIGLSPRREWGLVYEKLKRKDKLIFINEYNKAFLFTRTYSELTRLFLGKEIILKNIFLPRSAETNPERFVRSSRSDDMRWKEVLESIS